MDRLRDKDLLTSVILLILGFVFWSNSGDDVKDWIFPLLAAYLALGIAALLMAKAVFSVATNTAPDLIDRLSDHRIVLIDILVFSAIVLVYILLLYGLGFWLASFLMLTATSLYLTLEKTRRGVLVAVLVPLAVCVLAYVVFLRIFYVPLPEATWWTGFS
ncbi:MAG: tripartite tricarboxylate transporter TctB family protein [Alphaproteobacteria bacterium]